MLKQSLSSPHQLTRKKFNGLDGLDVAKVVWTTLWMAHEGSKPMRKSKDEMLEG
jgi:hypothetical protein